MKQIIYNSYDLSDYFEEDPYNWNNNERIIIRTKLDAIYAHLYKVQRDDLIYILDSFELLRNKEMEKYKEFKTKNLILDAYDKFLNQKELFE